ncbi:cystinosin isoform X1 [Cyprinodon tularosa]|uniref:cystinosin isoform X1 n=1 Tax=Cyprinodon tularosa TaxID=77115 RepID=UPI0018E21042|nr:cystinosin isoform X1 [Cyprinodon tularosa]XP_038130543.1 cystinosin isoform X1 [Cyprinodon tularosa]
MAALPLLKKMLEDFLPLMLLIQLSECGVSLNAPDAVTLEESSSAVVMVTTSSAVSRSTLIHLNVTYSSKENYSSIVALPEQVLLPEKTTSVNFTVIGRHAGQVTTFLSTNNTELNSPSTRIRFIVIHSRVLSVVAQVIGWVYFVAWSVSFYPQALENWRRKSVVGLNFDFLALNLTGFFAYSVFNVGLFWIPYIKEEFLQKNPNGINPVSANDVFFSLHALLLCAIYVSQAAVYEVRHQREALIRQRENMSLRSSVPFFQRGGQTVSWTARCLLLIGWTFALISLFVAVAQKITWLQYLYYFSYIKLAVTLIKYVPQAYMNYRRKSTEGWSIGNVLLDFTGGVFSILQMIAQSYNNDEWQLVFGDPTKFGLGLFSVAFDVVFMTQHYCLYRQPPRYEAIPEQRDD